MKKIENNPNNHYFNLSGGYFDIKNLETK